MTVDNDVAVLNLRPHRIPWHDFDNLARGDGGADIILRLRSVERSRRLLLLRSLMDKVTKDPDLYRPLSTPDDAWELLARVQAMSPDAFEAILAHPYTGSWLSYANRLVDKQITGVGPLWVHIGHFHALAASAAVRAGIPFHNSIPVWNGEAVLPTIGMARLATDTPWSLTEVRGDGNTVEIGTVRLPPNHSEDAPGWLGMRQSATVRLDDLDPYRGLAEPVTSKRTDEDEVEAWHKLLGDARQLVERNLPVFASGLAVGLDSIVPRPPVLFKNMSGSSSEAFGGAVIERPPDAISLAATLVHEFFHNQLNGLMRLVSLHDGDQRERFRTLWRNDPRPVHGTLHGMFSFFGVAGFWRAFANDSTGLEHRRAQFEFAYWRGGAWDTLRDLRHDPSLTPAGRRFVDRVAERLEPWQEEPVPPDIAALAGAAVKDQYAGWRLRHVRPPEGIVAGLAESWLAGRDHPQTVTLPSSPVPTPVPDGVWQGARLELTRFAITEQLPQLWDAVPGATLADLDYASGRDATGAYLGELREEPNSAPSWIGLGLALSARGTGPAAHALLEYPELVRAVHRRLRPSAPAPDELAAWIARFVVRSAY